MTREDAKREIKSRYAEYLTPAKKRVNGKPTYICPLPYCGNGSGKDGDGMAVDPHGDGTQLKCFKCGFYGDIIDLYRAEHQCDYGEAFRALCERFGIEVDKPTEWPLNSAGSPQSDRTMQSNTKAPLPAENAPEGKIEAVEDKQDYTTFYEHCNKQISDPEAQAYLSLRGISKETAERYNLGYELYTRALIIPVSQSFYVQRFTDPNAKVRYINAPDSQVELFNTKALQNDTGRPVFITEGAIDALSIIEAGGEAVALNSTSNTRKLLETLKTKSTRNTLILCLDNDAAGARATAELETGLKELNISYITADICGKNKDPNEALTADKSAFTGTIKAAESAAKPQPAGLLTLERAISILEAVDDHYLEMPGFPQLSEMAKIKTHDTIVIAADTGAGKSSLALNFLHELQDRYPALYINLEMDEATILQRLVAIHTGIELDEIEGYKHDSYTRSKVNEAISEIVGRKDISLLADVYDLKEIERQIQAVTKDRTEPTIVFIDTGLLVTTANKSASRYERFTQISEELRRISRLNNIVMFVLLQQNRAGKQDEKKEPTNSSLKESGSWENDATKIMFLWWNDKTQSKELAITKNRSGKTGSIKLNYSPHTQTYSEVKDIAINALQRKR